MDAYAESVKYFREENDGKLPSLKSLKKRKEELIKEIVEKKKAYAPLKEESRRLEIASDNVYSIFRKTNEMKSDLAWKREWEAKVREKARQEQARQGTACASTETQEAQLRYEPVISRVFHPAPRNPAGCVSPCRTFPSGRDF